MNRVSGNSSRKNVLSNLSLDDPHMIHTTTDEKVIETLRIEHQPCKGHGGWTEEDRRRSSDRSKDKWDEN
jgi:hypothetical protein